MTLDLFKMKNSYNYKPFVIDVHPSRLLKYNASFGDCNKVVKTSC